MQFQRLRLSGFKSFVEPTDLVIETGLTGIVGPNGCGKSNLVEALRWAMGETSARQMRGGEMDDVIFNGTAQRPARNIAEVSLVLHTNGTAMPPGVGQGPELEVTRRIERGQGSLYRVNGRDVRARDVQLLFADSATGARSPAIVSQGQVAAFIAAKPAQRRAVLEEAAGIAGLYSRRHEAELRLNAAATNLDRLDDVIATLETQLQALRRQARQANRYRRVSEQIRQLEAGLFEARWRQAVEAEAAAEAARAAADGEVATATGHAAAAATAQAEAAAALPVARADQAARAAELQRLIVTREGLAAEERRVVDAQSATEERLAEIARDIAREDARAGDAAAAAERLAAESGELDATAAEAREARDTVVTRRDGLREQVGAIESNVARLTESLAKLAAERAALDREIEAGNDRLTRLSSERAGVLGEHDLAKRETIEPAALERAAGDTAAATTESAAALAALDAALEATLNARAGEARPRNDLRAAEAALAGLDAEIKALTALLTADDGENRAAVIDAVAVDPGYEVALGAALGEDLNAALDPAAAMHWRTLPPLAEVPSLPGGVTPLARFVRGPEALTRRLAQIGVLGDGEDGEALTFRLAPGQRLVSRSGGLWRWDGFTVAAGAATPAAKRLAARNRLDALHGERDARASRAQAAGAALAAAEAVVVARQLAERAAHDAARHAQRHLAERRDQAAALRERAAVHGSRLAALAEKAAALGSEIALAERQISEAMEQRAAEADPAGGRGQLDQERAVLSERRNELIDLQSMADRLARESSDRTRRKTDIERELTAWRARSADARRQRESLELRATAERDNLTALARRPGEIAAQRDALFSLIDAGESRHRRATDTLQAAEARQTHEDRALKAADAALAWARENRIRAEGLVEQTSQSAQAIIERIRERLNCEPADLAELALTAGDDVASDLPALEARVERLSRERESLGPVNLRAEQESLDVEQQIASLRTEREDLIAAIAKLRRGIGELNREGRERLLAAFERVNEHFQRLFGRLFEGGDGHLLLVESDDPLEAGLEIMARPPGKKLQTLTLLSGGERALTALALLFAVFLTNPAPICVLDEVDAPLDEANVDRFCNLLVDLTQELDTRFLLVTHHGLTMARMDRLFGVTMTERGVSQLVSVDLRTAEGLRT